MEHFSFDISKTENSQALSLAEWQYHLHQSDQFELLEQFKSLGIKERSNILNLEFWQKDQFNFEHFAKWLQWTAQADDDQLSKELIDHPSFLLFIKAKFQITYQDQENPEYPDHDHFFVTDDQLFLFEYDSSFAYADEIRNLLKLFYSLYGVSKSVQLITQLIGDHYSTLEESSYQQKNSELREHGFMEYYESLDLYSLKSMIQIKKFIKSILDKDKLTSHSDQSKQRNSSEKQNFQISSTFSETLVEEFSKIQDKEQVKIQQFEYLKMINSIWQIEGLVQKGQIEINSELKFIHQNIELGISFIKRYFLQDLAGRNILDLFTFFQLFKIGRGLYHILKKNLVLLNSELSSDFLGETLQNIHLSLEEKKLDIRIGDSKLNLELINDYELVSELINSLLKNLNWIKAIESEFLKLVENGQISDHFYLNHTIKSIDFESLVLTLFMNYYLSVELNENRDQKLAINIDDLKRFWKSVDIVGQNSFHEKIDKIGKDFCLKYQLQNSNKLTQLILWFLESNYLSLDIRDLSDEDFKFIGGAIILAN